MREKGLAPIIIVILIALGAIGYLIYQNKQLTNSQTTQESSNPAVKQTSELNKFMNFTLPKGWKEETLNPANKSPYEIVYFISEDFEEDAIPRIIKGARIAVSRYSHDPNKSLRQEITENLPLPLKDQVDDISTIEIDDIEGLNKFVNYEGSYDHNYVIKDNYRWDIRFECAPGCETKGKMDASKYAEDRDLFIKSIKFLDQNQVDTSNWKTYTTNEFFFKYPDSWFIDPEKVKEGEYINFFLEGTTPDPTKSMHKFGNEVFKILTYGDESNFNSLKNAVPAPKDIIVDGKPALRFDNQVDILMRNKIIHLEFREGGKSYMDQIISSIRINQ